MGCCGCNREVALPDVSAKAPLTFNVSGEGPDDPHLLRLETDFLLLPGGQETVRLRQYTPGSASDTGTTGRGSIFRVEIFSLTDRTHTARQTFLRSHVIALPYTGQVQSIYSDDHIAPSGHLTFFRRILQTAEDGVRNLLIYPDGTYSDTPVDVGVAYVTNAYGASLSFAHLGSLDDVDEFLLITIRAFLQVNNSWFVQGLAVIDRSGTVLTKLMYNALPDVSITYPPGEAPGDPVPVGAVGIGGSEEQWTIPPGGSLPISLNGDTGTISMDTESTDSPLAEHGWYVRYKNFTNNWIFLNKQSLGTLHRREDVLLKNGTPLRGYIAHFDRISNVTISCAKAGKVYGTITLTLGGNQGQDYYFEAAPGSLRLLRRTSIAIVPTEIDHDLMSDQFAWSGLYPTGSGVPLHYVKITPFTPGVGYGAPLYYGVSPDNTVYPHASEFQTSFHNHGYGSTPVNTQSVRHKTTANGYYTVPLVYVDMTTGEMTNIGGFHETLPGGVTPTIFKGGDQLYRGYRQELGDGSQEFRLHHSAGGPTGVSASTYDVLLQLPNDDNYTLLPTGINNYLDGYGHYTSSGNLTVPQEDRGQRIDQCVGGQVIPFYRTGALPDSQSGSDGTGRSERETFDRAEVDCVGTCLFVVGTTTGYIPYNGTTSNVSVDTFRLNSGDDCPCDCLVPTTQEHSYALDIGDTFGGHCVRGIPEAVTFSGANVVIVALCVFKCVSLRASVTCTPTATPGLYEGTGTPAQPSGMGTGPSIALAYNHATRDVTAVVTIAGTPIVYTGKVHRLASSVENRVVFLDREIGLHCQPCDNLPSSMRVYVLFPPGAHSGNWTASTFSVTKNANGQHVGSGTVFSFVISVTLEPHALTEGVCDPADGRAYKVTLTKNGKPAGEFSGQTYQKYLVGISTVFYAYRISIDLNQVKCLDTKRNCRGTCRYIATGKNSNRPLSTENPPVWMRVSAGVIEQCNCVCLPPPPAIQVLSDKQIAETACPGLSGQTLTPQVDVKNVRVHVFLKCLHYTREFTLTHSGSSYQSNSGLAVPLFTDATLASQWPGRTIRVTITDDTASVVLGGTGGATVTNTILSRTIVDGYYDIYVENTTSNYVCIPIADTRNMGLDLEVRQPGRETAFVEGTLVYVSSAVGRQVAGEFAIGSQTFDYIATIKPTVIGTFSYTLTLTPDGGGDDIVFTGTTPQRYHRANLQTVHVVINVPEDTP